MNAQTKALIQTADDALDLPVVKRMGMRLLIAGAFALGAHHGHAETPQPTTQTQQVAISSNVRIADYAAVCGGAQNEECEMLARAEKEHRYALRQVGQLPPVETEPVEK